LVTAAARILLGLIWHRPAARAGTLLVVGSWVAIDLVYIGNVRLLPGEYFLSARSLAFDSLVLLAIAIPLGWLGLRAPAATFRGRWRGARAALGVVLCLCAGAVLISNARATSANRPKDREGPNLLVIVMDSARRDRFGMYGYSRPTTPSIDALAAHSRIYDAAYAASSWTVPSVHTILQAGPAEPAVYRLAAKGYRTASFSDNPHLSYRSDLNHGFEELLRSVGSWRIPFRRTVVGEVIERLVPGSDRELVDRVLEWAQTHSQPLFVYVHLMDSHTPYRWPRIDRGKGSGRHIEFPRTGMDITPEEAEDIAARYDGGIRSSDEEVGRLLTAARGWGRPFVAIVTADHGESLGESGRWFHGGTLAPELLSIPLLVIGEGIRPGRVTSPVGHASIVPTLLAAAGLGCQGCIGSDLRSSEGDSVVEGGLAPALRYRIANGYKLVLNQQTGQRSLFALNDVADSRDLSKELPRLSETLAARLQDAEEDAAAREELRDRLRTLGYFGSGGQP
jgi:hypothetical protein